MLAGHNVRGFTRFVVDGSDSPDLRIVTLWIQTAKLNDFAIESNQIPDATMVCEHFRITGDFWLTDIFLGRDKPCAVKERQIGIGRYVTGGSWVCADASVAPDAAHRASHLEYTDAINTGFQQVDGAE